MSIEDQNPAMTPSIQGPAQEDSVPKQSAATVEPNVFWDRAYDSLRENQPKLVEAYEKVLSSELSGTPTVSPSDIQQNRNIINQKDIIIRRYQMK